MATYRENKLKTYTVASFNQLFLQNADIAVSTFDVDRKVYVNGLPTGDVEKKTIMSMTWPGGQLNLSPDATKLYQEGKKDQIQICALQVQSVDTATGELVWEDCNMFNGKKIANNMTILHGGI